MALRHPISERALPKLWLMTDERMGEALWAALAALPRGSGVVFRHFATPEAARIATFNRIATIARRRGLVLVRAGANRQPVHLGAAHSVREGMAARRAGAHAILVSPVYPTRTHPGARALGPVRAAQISRAVGLPAIALGGVTVRRFRGLKQLGFVGWAAIDGLTPLRPGRV
ncbi:Thiamine monophosphate synthase [compost metagenome]|uniref:Thiamine phosphate synthase n=3 Tax=Pseudomonadota TaxID=1224 RepID=A0ABU4PHK2_9SPHN|nr:thiamine phosphate synthase [Sphingomonas echinoides]MDX5982899.1 thiamine phosphate synthase [Sphingomonas echinoides]